ncbi:hypothetical protein J5N97_022795 [Dioscorea zingiberensis]|uniref:F-box domain-containing protein n=1 Tax=Dioscorea zingiberensis TaxID=325984 RepID=A0A9D5HAY5_9LILI|nr:hypothetical protein J5N97_022766 [Dioscorea zingiberensis]KAJ0969918.1 hypothetical protein J5N97_022795 [Dioscorea zingiberensis]
MTAESMAFKQKRRVKNGKNKYLKPQYGKSRNNSAKKTDSLQQFTPPGSHTISNFDNLETSNVSNLHKLPATPKTPDDFGSHSQSMLESLPLDILVRIMCCLHHDQLRAVFHVSRKIRIAVILARQNYFNYTTPDRARQEMLLTKTPLPTEHWPFQRKSEGNERWKVVPQTPKAPKHGPRPPRANLVDMKQVAAILFQESIIPTNNVAPPRRLPMNSSRVLLYEDELCQAVAQNRLR